MNRPGAAELVARLTRAPLSRARALARELREERRLRSGLDLVARCDLDASDLTAHRRRLAEAARLDAPVKTVNWYLPVFENAFYGGVHTVLRFASGWRERHGIESRFLLYDGKARDVAPARARIAAAFPALAEAPVVATGEGRDGAGRLAEADAGIATLWTGAYALARDRAVWRKLYFLQDDERLFYPAGTASALCGATWRLGLPAIVNTPGLAQVYARETGAPVFPFVPAVDREVFHEPEAPRPATPFRVFFYARPAIDRNAFELGVAALAKLRRRRPRRVEVVAAGSGVPPAIAASFGEIAFKGLLPYRETGAIYRSCHAGLALMMTRHPSYLPFELMACGAVPVATVNPDCAWLLRDGENAVVTEPSVSAICEALDRLEADPARRDRLAGEGARTAGAWSWDEQVDRAAGFLRSPGVSVGAAATGSPP